MSTPETPESKAVALPPHALAVLAELKQAQDAIQQQAQGVLRVAMRELGLSGNWRLEGDSLVRDDLRGPAVQPLKEG